MRKIARVDIHSEGRDKGKCFLITEMPAMQAERWAIRLLLALTRAGVEVPEGEGMAAVAQLKFTPAIFGRLPFDEATVLLDEMMSCVKIVREPSKAISYDLMEDDVEEIATIFKLRMEVVALHTGFSLPAYPSTLTMLGEAGLSFTHIGTSRQSLPR